MLVSDKVVSLCLYRAVRNITETMGGLTCLRGGLIDDVSVDYWEVECEYCEEVSIYLHPEPSMICDKCEQQYILNRKRRLALVSRRRLVLVK